MNWDFIYRGETRDISDAVRAAADGAFLRLSDGTTHYQLAGPEGGTPVVLVHGFSVPYFIWDPTFAALSAAGFRVLRYDLFGRGLSDRPPRRYNIDLFVRQLRELLDGLGFEKVNLTGLSMGGPITVTFTTRFPERVNKLALIDPVGTHPMPLSWLYKLAVLPGISEVILGLAGTERMVRGIASDFFDPEHVAMFQEKYRTQMKFRGFKRAILSTLRNRMVSSHTPAYQQLGKLDVPVLLFWGRDDSTLPFEQSRGILELVPRAEFHVIEDCGHIPHYEKPEILNPILIQFLQR